MNFRKLLSSIIIGTVAVSGLASTKQAQSNRVSAHQKAHSQQLANVNSKLDLTSINHRLQEDILARENVSKISLENDQMLSDLLNEARKHIGKPYRHGMRGPSAFDCSGFSSYVYKQFGFNLSPASRAQFLEGKKVDRKNLRKGDLVFFTSRSSGKNVGHVGIVVNADNNTGDFSFIHASIRGVKISECTGYYANRYIGARRIIE